MSTLRQAIPATPADAARSAVRVLALLALTLLTTGLVFRFAGADPIEAFDALIRGSLGNRLGIEQTVELMSVLILAGLAFALPARAGLFNIGGEGQIYAGALAAVTVGLKLEGLGPVWLTVASLLAGVFAGSLLGAVPGLLKAGAGASEVLTTLVFNFIAILATYYAIGHLFPATGIRGSTPELGPGVELPDVPGQEFTSGIVLALLCAAGLSILLSRTRLGLKVRASGLSPDAARHNGIGVGRVYVASLAIGGAFAGLAGAIVVLGIDGLLARDFSPGYGFIGIAVALLARSRPLWIVPAAALFSIVTVGSSYLEPTVGLSAAVGLVIQSVFLLLLLALWVFRPERTTAAGGG